MTAPGASDRPLDSASPGGMAPFRHLAFTVLWTATVMSNVGTWMHDVAAGWLMTSLSPSPMMVALVQTATTLPVFLFSLAAGALADIVDRRRLLIAAQAAMAVVAGLLATLVVFDLVTPPILLLFTLMMGTGAAFVAPAWQAIVPKLVDRGELRQAIALNSVGINLSRAVGPAAAGFVIASVGIWAPFALNMISFLGVILALLWWRPRAAPTRSLASEQFGGALRAGLRYVRANGPMRATLARAVSFFVFASAYWALLPLVARELLDGGPTLYGVLLGCVGVGAVGGAVLLPKANALLGMDRLVVAGTIGTAAALLVFAIVPNAYAAAGASLVAGASWIAVLSSLNVSAQTSLADWVRARGLSIFVTVFFGSMSAGSLVWGQMAAVAGIPAALVIAAVGAVIVVPAIRRWTLGQAEGVDLSPSMHWPAPVVTSDVTEDRGPVMVIVEYRVDPARVGEFAAAMRDLAEERRRDGAYAWGLFEDAAHPGEVVEYFLVASWLEHLRQHERVTKGDADIQSRTRAFQIDAVEPVVRHLIAPKGI